MGKRLLVLSFDALGGEDFEYIKGKLEFKEFFARAAVCTNVSSVYPSVTYPCHASIVTGKYPKNHGVISNTLFQPKRVNAPDWYWQRKYTKSDTIFDVAIRSGMTVGAFLWPVTARSKIQYLLPEIVPNRIWDNQMLASLRSGTPAFILKLFKQYRHLLNGIHQPYLDEFVTQSVIHTIKTKSPDMMLIHFTDLDTARHNHGVRSKKAYEAIDRLGDRFARIINILKEENLFDATTVVILGDHFQLDYHTKVPLNNRLADAGWLNFVDGKVMDWKALVKSNGGSAYVYVKDGNVDRVGLRAFLDDLKGRSEYGIERILTGNEAGKEGADPRCAFMLEARVGYVFTDFLGGGKKGKRADHGYHPTWKDGYGTFYAMAGSGVRQGASISSMSLVDIAPTWARLLGLTLGDVDGNAVLGMLED